MLDVSYTNGREPIKSQLLYILLLTIATCTICIPWQVIVSSCGIWLAKERLNDRMNAGFISYIVFVFQLARAVAAYHRDKQAKEIKAERDEANRLRKIAANIAKEVKQFWVNIEKVSFNVLKLF